MKPQNKIPKAPKQKLKVWTLYMRNNFNDELLHMCVGYSLEQAIEHAWDWLKFSFPNVDARGYMPRMYLSMVVDELTKLPEGVEQSFPMPVATEPLSKTNKLMEKIIKTKDSKLFKKSKRKLNTLEVKYIEEKLNQK